MKKAKRNIAIFRWDLLHEITWKNRETMQRYFQRNNLCIQNAKDIEKYLSTVISNDYIDKKYTQKIEEKNYKLQLLRNTINRLRKNEY